MSQHILAENLTKTYRVPVREGGMRAAFHSLIHARYQEVRAVDGVSFSIDQGEIVGFIGPNGAGKTTTLKMLSGLLYPTHGAVRAAGFIPWKRNVQYLRKISMLMGNRSQMQWNNTVYDTMVIFKEIYNVPTPQFKRHLEELADLFEVEGLFLKRARNLSLGERSKCEMIIALLHRPEILYLDEPTLGMDVSMQLRLRAYIKQYNQRFGATVMITSHYMSDIQSLCQRVMLINGGKLLYDGNLTGLTKRLAPFRMIRITLHPDNPPFLLENLGSPGRAAQISERDDNSYTLRVEQEHTVALCSALMNHYELVDLSIQEPPLEAVIDQIYHEGVVA